MLKLLLMLKLQLIFATERLSSQRLPSPELHDFVLDIARARFYHRNVTLDERRIFLLDGMGAALSAVILLFVLPTVASEVGLSTALLRGLGALALVLAIFSLSRMKFGRVSRPSFLIGVAMANLLYSLLTIAVVFFSPTISWIGQVYLVTEVGIIWSLVRREVQVDRKLTSAARPPLEGSLS